MTNLYSPYRSIGYISDGNPFCLNYLGEELFIVVSIRNSFQVIRYNKLITCMVSKAISVVDNNNNRGSDEDDNDDDGGGDDDEDGSGVINAIQVNGHETFVAINKEIIVYDRLDIVRRFNEHNQRIIGLLAIGAILISYDIGNHIKVINNSDATVDDDVVIDDDDNDVIVIDDSNVEDDNHDDEHHNFMYVCYVYTAIPYLSFLHHQHDQYIYIYKTSHIILSRSIIQRIAL